MLYIIVCVYFYCTYFLALSIETNVCVKKYGLVHCWTCRVFSLCRKLRNKASCKLGIFCVSKERILFNSVFPTTYFHDWFIHIWGDDSYCALLRHAAVVCSEDNVWRNRIHLLPRRWRHMFLRNVSTHHGLGLSRLITDSDSMSGGDGQSWHNAVPSHLLLDVYVSGSQPLLRPRPGGWETLVNGTHGTCPYPAERCKGCVLSVVVYVTFTDDRIGEHDITRFNRTGELLSA
jgi:hypothetical protein